MVSPSRSTSLLVVDDVALHGEIVVVADLGVDAHPGDRLWIITEADRSVTTLPCPRDIHATPPLLASP